MDSSRRSPSPPSHGRSRYDSGRRNDYGKGREQDNGWARRRLYGEPQREREQERDGFPLTDAKNPGKHGHSGRGDIYSDSKRLEGRSKSYGGPSRDRSRSRSPPRKRRRSRSRSGDVNDRGGRRGEHKGGHRDSSGRPRDDEHREHRRRDEDKDRGTLVRREEGVLEGGRSRCV
jgi:hypothetical protein